MSNKYSKAIRSYLILEYFFDSFHKKLSAKQVCMLNVIDKHNIKTIRELREFYENYTSEIFVFDYKYFITKHLNKLEDNDLVIKSNSKEDKRIRTIEITSKGKKLAEKYRIEIRKFIDKLDKAMEARDDRN